jgi:hypothetical protein
MPVDLLMRLDLDKLYPPFLEALLEVLASCRAQGTDFWATRGFATYAEQMALWCQGRTKEGKIVTFAKAGESAHNFGLAVDLCPDALQMVPKLQPDWRPEAFELLGPECFAQGLEWGGRWPGRKVDRPHVQWPLPQGGLTLVRKAFEADGLEAAWSVVDGFGGDNG